MKTPLTSTFSLRDWFGIVAGVCWGLALSRFFAADDMTGPWLVILFGPPLVPAPVLGASHANPVRGKSRAAKAGQRR